MPIRLYALAKQWKLDSKALVDYAGQAGITGKGSALASLTDDETEKLKAHLDQQALIQPEEHDEEDDDADEIDLIPKQKITCPSPVAPSGPTAPTGPHGFSAPTGPAPSKSYLASAAELNEEAAVQTVLADLHQARTRLNRQDIPYERRTYTLHCVRAIDAILAFLDRLATGCWDTNSYVNSWSIEAVLDRYRVNGQTPAAPSDTALDAVRELRNAIAHPRRDVQVDDRMLKNVQSLDQWVCRLLEHLGVVCDLAEQSTSSDPDAALHIAEVAKGKTTIKSFQDLHALANPLQQKNAS